MSPFGCAFLRFVLVDVPSGEVYCDPAESASGVDGYRRVSVDSGWFRRGDGGKKRVATGVESVQAIAGSRTRDAEVSRPRGEERFPSGGAGGLGELGASSRVAVRLSGFSSEKSLNFSAAVAKFDSSSPCDGFFADQQESRLLLDEGVGGASTARIDEAFGRGGQLFEPAKMRFSLGVAMTRVCDDMGQPRPPPLARKSCS